MSTQPPARNAAPARADQPLELDDEARLPDARLPADEHRPGLPVVRAVQCRRQRGELLAPANERRTRDAPSHPHILTPKTRLPHLRRTVSR